MFSISQPDLLANKKKKFILSSHIFRKSNGSLSIQWAPFPIKVTDTSTMVPSPSGSKLLVIRNSDNESPTIFEIWGPSQLEKELHVPQSTHGSVYADGWFEGISWNSDETLIAIAEEPASGNPCLLMRDTRKTIESLNLLKRRNTKFIVAMNKVDKLYGWKACHKAPILKAMKQPSEDVKWEFNIRFTKGTYLHHNEIKSPQGIKITTQGHELSLSDDVDDLKESAMEDMRTVMNKIDKSGEGVYVKALFCCCDTETECQNCSVSFPILILAPS